MKSIQLNLNRKNYQYQVKIGSCILKESLDEALQHYDEADICYITNDTIDAIYPDFADQFIPERFKVHQFILKDGEQFKTLDAVSSIYDFFAKKHINRNNLVIAFGGGVVGDIVGFAAASYMRGIPFIQVPTTLLSQVDSSIGGKTGVNHPSGKNMIGAFNQPYQTIIDIDFLKTLPMREFIAGYSELIKHGMIHDSYLFQILKNRLIPELKDDALALIDAIFRSCEVKARVVENDEKESGLRAILNFGHTLGHLLETYTNYEKYLHGEAVLAGIDFAAWWSMKENHLEEKDYQLIHKHIKNLDVPILIPQISKEAFKKLIEHDKKFSGKGVKFIGLTTIGNAAIFEGVSSESLWEYFQEYIQLKNGIVGFL